MDLLKIKVIVTMQITTLIPNATDICGDGIDQNCDGRDEICLTDIDNDYDGFTQKTRVIVTIPIHQSTLEQAKFVAMV